MDCIVCKADEPDFLSQLDQLTAVPTLENHLRFWAEKPSAACQMTLLCLGLYGKDRALHAVSTMENHLQF